MPKLPVLATLVLSLLGGSSAALGDDAPSPEHWIQTFSRDWGARKWSQRSPRTPTGYMRAADDDSWRLRMQALQALIAHGTESIPALVDALQNSEAHERILAAQALGYLAPEVPGGPLWQAAKHDKQAAVRLYAVDALGMQGDTGSSVDWDALRKDEKNRDVLKHINYALERGDAAVDAAMVAKLQNLDVSTIDTAIVGKPAPQFQLTSVNGQDISLADFRGKQNVVLVFVYGDT